MVKTIISICIMDVIEILLYYFLDPIEYADLAKLFLSINLILAISLYRDTRQMLKARKDVDLEEMGKTEENTDSAKKENEI